MAKVNFNDLMNSKVYKYYDSLLEQNYRTSSLIYFMDLEDYKQEQHLNTIQRLKDYNDKYALSTFIHLIVGTKHGMMVRAYNTNKRKVNNPQNLFYLDQQTDINEKIDFHGFLTVNEDVDNDITFNIIDVMTEDEKTIVGLILMDYKRIEIARMIGVSKNTVTNRMNALRKKLKRHFEEIGIMYYNK